MATNENLLKKLFQNLESLETLLIQVEEAKKLAPDLLHQYQLNLGVLQNKHIPAEMCSEDKLVERVMEVEVLLDNLKWELENSGDSE